MGCSQNAGPLLVVEYIAALNIWGCQSGTLILGTTHRIQPVDRLRCSMLLGPHCCRFLFEASLGLRVKYLLRVAKLPKYPP